MRTGKDGTANDGEDECCRILGRVGRLREATARTTLVMWTALDQR